MPLRNIAASMRHLRAGRAAVAAGNVLACAGLIGFIACSDGGVTEPAAPKVAAVSHPSADVAPNWWYPPAPIVQGDTTINTFTIDPHAGGAPYFGPNNRHQIVIPGNAICDPLTSGYGPTYWSKTCTPATRYITFVVKSWKGVNGSPKLAFSPDVRFAPSQTVLLKINTTTTSTTTSSSGAPVIYWCTSVMVGCVNEGTTDSSLGTSFDPFATTAWRRVKHLSGYNVAWGRTDPSVY